MIINSEMGGMWEAVKAHQRSYLSIYLEGQRKTIRKPSHGSQSQSQDSNQGPPKYEAGMPAITTHHSVIFTMNNGLHKQMCI